MTGSPGRPVRRRAELDDLGEAPGRCGECTHLRLVRSSRSAFAYCYRSTFEPRFPRFPRLPVLECDGYEPRDPRLDSESP